MSVARAKSIINADLRASEVNLENMELDSLEPILPLLATMPRLKSLRLAHNNLTGIPDDLASIRQLDSLDLSDNPVTGLSTIMSGLYCLVVLRHLSVHLPSAAEEDELIIALPSLESLNETWLTENYDEDEADDERAAERAEAAPRESRGVLRPFSPSPTSSRENPMTQPPQKSRAAPPNDNDDDGERSSNSADDLSDARLLFASVAEALGTAAGQREFDTYAANVAQHLSMLKAGETDSAVRDGETLKAQRVLQDYCVAELCRAAAGRDAAIGRALTIVARAQSALHERYDALWRRIADDRNKRLSVMKREMRDAIREIESLMAQVGQSGRAPGDDDPSRIPSNSNNHHHHHNHNHNNNNNDSDTHHSQSQSHSHNYSHSAGGDAEVRRQREEIGWLRTENERLATRLRLVEASPSPLAFRTASGAPAESAERCRTADALMFAPQPSASSPRAAQAQAHKGKVLTLKQLRAAIEDIYASKSKYDIKCSESHLPRETMEQHMYTYLNQRYGLKHIILDWATAIINGIKRYGPDDNDVAVFGKILRNEIDEEFRFVQRQVRETVHELLRVYVKGKHPSKSDMDINKMVQKKASGSLLEDEWVDIVKYMYNAQDAVSIILRVRDHLRQITQPRRRRVIQRGHEPPEEPAQLPYADVIRILLDFQLEGHDRFLAQFLQIFRQHDSDRNGIINEPEFFAVVRGVDADKTEEEIHAILELIDPYSNQLITYSECVTYLSSDIMKMMKKEEKNPQTMTINME